MHHTPSVLALTLCSALAVSADAQTAPATASTTPPPNAPAYSTVEVGPHYRVWEAPASPQGSDGTAPAKTHRVTEIGSGLNFWDTSGAQPQWSPAQAYFEVQSNGFVSSRTYCQAQIAADINTVGAVNTSTPDGTTLNSSPIGIGLFDPVSGNSVLLASITNCLGTLVTSNQVLFSDAFPGVASILYTVRKGSLSQDTIVTANIDPTAYGFPDSSRIEIYSEFYGSPTPQTSVRPLYIEQDPAVRQSMATPDFIDYTLLFGPQGFGPGRAYSAPNGLTNTAVSAPTAKSFFQTADGRWILCEQVQCSSIKRALQALPASPAHSRAKPKRQSAKTFYASLPKAGSSWSSGASRPSAASAFSSFKVQGSRFKVQGSPPPPIPSGVTIDYELTIAGDYYQPFTFLANVTYFISSPAYFFSQVVFEGSAILKFPSVDPSIDTNLDWTVYIQINGPCIFKTGSYSPCVATAGDDDDIGSTVNGIWSGYTGNPHGNVYAAPAIYFASGTSVNLANMRFLYAGYAILVSSQDVAVADCQFINCQMGVAAYGSSSIIQLNNCLFSSVGLPLEENQVGGYDNSWSLCNCTVDTCSYVMDPGGDYGATLSCTNSIFSNFSYSDLIQIVSDVTNAFYNGTPFGDPSDINLSSSPYQTAGLGAYYLCDGSPLRNAGTFAIDPGLLADLRTRTTYPPIVYSAITISNNTVLGPQAQRDTDEPDLGFHYPSLDHLFTNVVSLSANLALTPGTVAAWAGSGQSSYTIKLLSGGSVNFQGTATQPVWWAHADTAQEGEVNDQGSSGLASFTSTVVQN